MVVSMQQRLESSYGHLRWALPRRSVLHSQGLFLSPWLQHQASISVRIPSFPPFHSWHKGFALVRQGALVAVDPSKRETVWQRRLREAAKHTAGKPAFTLDAANEAAQAH